MKRAPIKSESPYTEIAGAHRRYETQCVEDLCDLVPKGTPVVEFFGGLGLLAEVFNRKIQPTQFSTCEMHEDLYLKLAEQFGDQAHHGDTFSHSFDKITPGSLVSLDFNKFTTLTLVTGVTKDRDYLKDFKEIEQRGAKYVHLTDCAGLKMHFHLHNYSKRFNHKVEDRYDYCQAVQPTYRNLLEWNMLGFRYHPGAFHFLFSTSSYPQTEPCATFDNKNVRGFPSGKK